MWDWIYAGTPPSPPLPPSRGISISTQAERLGVSVSHTPQLCTWNCSHSRMAVNPHTCSHLRPAPLDCHLLACLCFIHQLMRVTQAEWAGGVETMSGPSDSHQNQFWNSWSSASVIWSCRCLVTFVFLLQSLWYLNQPGKWHMKNYRQMLEWELVKDSASFTEKWRDVV